MIPSGNNISSLNGLVLTGGKSTRMGISKDLIKWHTKEQRYYIADMMKHFCEDVFISCRPDQEKEMNSAYNTLPDTIADIGPLGGILSAFQSEPGKAWLVIACDLPLVNEETIRFLVANRDRTKMATTYKNPSDDLPEPLITIWEPGCYPVLLSCLKEKATSPRAVLINSEVALLQPAYPEALLNVNTPEDAIEINAILNKEKGNQQK